MEDQSDELLSSLEKLKEVHRMQFDYFKQLSTLSTGSIGAIIAFIAKIFPKSECVILASLSLLCFLVCLIISLLAMKMPVNMTLDLTAIRTIATSTQKKPEERKKDSAGYSDNYLGGIKQIKIFDLITMIIFLIGIVLFLVYAGIGLKSLG